MNDLNERKLQKFCLPGYVISIQDKNREEISLKSSFKLKHLKILQKDEADPTFIFFSLHRFSH